MNELLQGFFIGLPWALAVLIPFAAVVGLLVGKRTASLWVAIYYVLIFSFPNSSSFGVLDVAASSNFYARATGTLFFSAINIMLFGLAIQAFVSRRMRLGIAVQHNLKWPAILFGAVLLGNLLVGMTIQQTRWFQVIGYSGLVNVANFMLAFYVLTSALREPKDLERFVNVLLFCAVMRGLWGVARFVALGGDPSNFYANFQDIHVRITFFDVNDSLVALLALFVVGWRLVTSQAKGAGQRALYWFIVALELFIIVFSYRRTAWGGLVLAGLLFAFAQPRARTRNWLLASYVLLGLPLLMYKLVQRSGSATSGLSLLERVVPDIMKGGKFTFTSGRFSELYAAWQSIESSPLWGLGSWGRYDAFRFSELAWHHGDFTWMHSGVLHLMLKTGLLGVCIMLAVLVLFFRFVVVNRRTLDTRHRGLFYLGAAGVLFMLPVWLLGTPVIEFRTMQLLPLCFALPYLALAVARAEPASPVVAEPRRTAGWGLAPPRRLRPLLNPQTARI